MANNFIGMCYAIVKDAGYNTEEMTTKEVVEKFYELQDKNNLKRKTTEIEEIDEVPEDAIGFSYNKFNEEHKQEISKLINTLKGIKKIKTKELIEYIKSLEPISLRTNGKEIIAEFDKFTARENIFGDSVSDNEGYNYKLKNIKDLPSYIETSKYSNSSKASGKNVKSHIGVKEWHYFLNTIATDDGIFDITVNIRDKGDKQYIYLVSFKKNIEVEILLDKPLWVITSMFYIFIICKRLTKVNN